MSPSLQHRWPMRDGPVLSWSKSIEQLPLLAAERCGWRHANDRIELPAFLEGKVERALYLRWLGAKAQAHARRDFARGLIEATRANYRWLIHAAVVESEGRDFYTGEMLDWHLIGTYRNEASTNGKHAYKKTLKLLPTLDHHEAAATVAVFKICAWRTNDSKHDLTTAEFIELSKRILEHHGFTVTAPV